MSPRAYKSALLITGVGWTSVACLIITISDRGSDNVKLIVALAFGIGLVGASALINAADKRMGLDS